MFSESHFMPVVGTFIVIASTLFRLRCHTLTAMTDFYKVLERETWTGNTQ